MKRRLFNLLAALSAALCLAAGLAYAFSYSWNIQLSQNRIITGKGELTLSVLPFNGQIRFARQQWDFGPRGERHKGFVPGFQTIFVRRQEPGLVSGGFEYVSTKAPGIESAYLGVPLWFLMLLFSLLPAVYVWRERKVRATLRHKQRGLCLGCGYDLRATPARCPECGTEAMMKRYG